LKVVLDSWAVLRWLEGVEPAASRVESAVADGAVMSWINLGEVFYVVWRASGESAAWGTVNDIRAAMALDEATPARVLAAARIKAEHAMALAAGPGRPRTFADAVPWRPTSAGTLDAPSGV